MTVSGLLHMSDNLKNVRDAFGQLGVDLSSAERDLDELSRELNGLAEMEAPAQQVSAMKFYLAKSALELQGLVPRIQRAVETAKRLSGKQWEIAQIPPKPFAER